MILKWKLDDIVAEKDFEALFKKVESGINRFDRFFRIMSPDMDEKEFEKFISFSEKFKEDLSSLSYMPFLMEAVDQKSQKVKMLKNRVKDLEVKLADRSRKIWHWIKGKEIINKPVLDKKNARRLFRAVPDLEYVLIYGMEFAKHTLNESEESIILNKDTNGVSTLTDLRTLIETEFEYFFKPEGSKRGKKIKTQAELVRYVYSSGKKEREAAYRTLLSKYRENIDKFFMVYQAVVKDWVYEARLRNYRSPISIRNKYNHIPDEAINILLDVCTDNRNIFWDYFRFKAREMKLRKLRRFDIYAPVREVKKNIPLDDAINIVLDTLGDFFKGFYEKAKEIIESEHVDSHPRPVKVSGAFCATVAPGITPYILLNYTGNYRDVLTLAHELGHGIHSIYASNHSISSQGASLPLSEMASTFSEMLVFEKLLEQTETSQARKSLLINKIADSYATILRQNYFVKFEIEAHKQIGHGLTPEGLSDIYFENLKEQFGNSVIVDPLFRYEWAYIPHIVNSPFYCYAYNFGELLSLSLYSEYKKQGKKFVPKIEKILSYGGSKKPEEILKEVGVDVNLRSFWQGSFDIIKVWQKELEQL